MEDAEIILRSNHLPLKNFFQKNTINTKVNNRAVEISPCKIEFEYIKGIKNTLADTMSRLIQIDPDAKLCPEQEGYEFGYHALEDMEPVRCEVQEIKTSQLNDPIPLPQEEIKLPLVMRNYKPTKQKINFAKILVVNYNKDSYKIKIHTIWKMES